MTNATIKRYPPDFEEGVEAPPAARPRAMGLSTGPLQLVPPPFEIGIAPRPASRAASAFATGACAVDPIAPITDQLAQRMEDGERVIWDSTDPRLQPAADRLVELILAEPDGTARVTSAFRPRAYQDHLREVWEKANDVRIKLTECADVGREVDAEMTNHGLRVDRPVGKTSNHTSGRAVDIDWQLPTAKDPNARVATLAATAGLRHPMPEKDRVHFELA